MTLWRVTFRIHRGDDLKRDVEMFEESSKIISAVSDAANKLHLANTEEIARVTADKA